MSYYYSPYYFSPYYPYCAPDQYGYVVCYVYPQSYVTTQKSSQRTGPLTYVLATTPEYEDLLKKHEELRHDYEALVSRHNELSSRYESLRTDYDQTVAKYKQLGSAYNSATLELNSYKTSTYILILVTIILGGALGFLLLRRP